MEIVLGTILGYLVGLAANLRTDAIVARREERLREQLEREDDLRKALASTRSLREELRIACAELARNRHRLGITPQEEPLWRLLSDDAFQVDLVEWLMAGGIEEGNAVKERLLRRMETVLAHTGASPEQIAFLRSGYFDALDKAVFAHPILALWRHQLTLDYLREQVAVLRRSAEEAAGVYSPQKQKAALDRYGEKSLAAWDIIDLSNLPEGDIHMATQKLLLRQLYLPLRIEVEPTKRGEAHDAVLARLEEQREARRHREASLLFTDEPDRPDRTVSRCPVGERLGASRRLVVLGDPGSGKTTMLRWMATAFLLRHKGDDEFSQIPDTQTLPSQPWIPVLTRCRDLGEVDLCCCFTDFLSQHLYKTELLPEEAEVVRAVILDRIAKGEALLLVDGLDEITNPYVRILFCQELERTAARYPDAPIVVTSRIVGYRDMPYRMGSGFEHCVIAELNREDKDLFARRWVHVTEQYQPTGEKAKRVQELLDALYSSDRIERLTGNPMLLTTLALVKRKVGKLPNRRTKLYAEAVSVLLNWNPRLYQSIEEDEAIPQLEYLAYEMCRRGVQRLTDDEVLELLEKVRAEYPNIRAIRRREPQAFLALLEARSSILIKSGGIWQNDQQKPIWEFRHLTFQEYLAARALLDGRYPSRDKTKSLAEQAAPLAGAVQIVNVGRYIPATIEEVEVSESWREALRLLVADCKDDDVDDVLLSILNPLTGEDAEKTRRTRAVLAALCLADEPNLSGQTAADVLVAFAAAVSEDVVARPKMLVSSLRIAAREVGRSSWAPLLKKCLIEECLVCPQQSRLYVSGLWGFVEFSVRGQPDADLQPWVAELVSRLHSNDQIEVISAAMAVMYAAFQGNVLPGKDLVEALLECTKSDWVKCEAAVSALFWLAGGFPDNPKEGECAFWHPTDADCQLLAELLNQAPEAERNLRRFLVHLLGKAKTNAHIKDILARLEDSDAEVRRTAFEALGQLGDKQAVQPLVAKLDDPDINVRIAAIKVLVKLGDKEAVQPLLAKLDDPRIDVRMAAIRALGQLGDKEAVLPLLAKLDEADADVRVAAIVALVMLGDKRAVPPLLANLDDPDADVRVTVIRALVKLGDEQAIEPLILLLDDLAHQVCAAAAAALTALGAARGSSALTEFLNHGSPERRKAAVEELLRMRAKPNEWVLLSQDLDGRDPWMDPSAPITETRIAAAARKLGITSQEVRYLYESIAADFHLRFA
jgi:HEAT repeat protein